MFKRFVPGVHKKNGYKTFTIVFNELKLAEHNTKTLNDTHTKNQVNRFNIRVCFGLTKIRVILWGVWWKQRTEFPTHNWLFFIDICVSDWVRLNVFVCDCNIFFMSKCYWYVHVTCLGVPFFTESQNSQWRLRGPPRSGTLTILKEPQIYE